MVLRLKDLGKLAVIDYFGQERKAHNELDDLSVGDWLQHAKEEMLDAAIYLQKLQDVQAQLKQ